MYLKNERQHWDRIVLLLLFEVLYYHRVEKLPEGIIVISYPSIKSYCQYYMAMIWGKKIQ